MQNKAITLCHFFTGKTGKHFKLKCQLLVKIWGNGRIYTLMVRI